MSRLTRTQVRALQTIKRMCDSSEEVAHDLCGDLSITSGNWPATYYGLARRGLVDGEYHPDRHEEECWTYTITTAGRRALADHGRKALAAQKGGSDADVG